MMEGHRKRERKESGCSNVNIVIYEHVRNVLISSGMTR